MIEKIAGYANFDWIDINKLDEEAVEVLSSKYKLHNLALKDCMEPDHLPKFEKLENFSFIILRIHSIDVKLAAHTAQEVTNKIAIFYNEHTLVTVHRKEFQFLEDLKISGTAQQHYKTPHELVSKILWHAVHSFEKPAMDLSKEIDDIESVIFLKSIHPSQLERFYFLKRQASIGRKMLLQTQDILGMHTSTPNDSSMLQDIRDLHHRLLHLFEQALEDVSSLSSIYISLSAQKTNEVMKVLTIFSAFFMPLTFIAGIYGMNFVYMPELKMRYGYPACLLFMLFTALVIFIWFKRKKLV